MNDPKVRDLIEDIVILRSHLKWAQSNNRLLRKKIELLRLRLSLFESEPDNRHIPTQNPFLFDIKAIENQLIEQGKDMDDETFYSKIAQMSLLTTELLSFKPENNTIAELN